jgi:hypothetical protein
MGTRSSLVGKWNNIQIFVVRGIIDEGGSKTGTEVGRRRKWHLFQVLKGVHERGEAKNMLMTRVTWVGDSVMATQRGLVGSTSTRMGFVSLI